jgi:hypothetical protein
MTEDITMTPPSRPAWLRAIEQALRQLGTEYQAWRDALPENLAESAMADHLEETIAALRMPRTAFGR